MGNTDKIEISKSELETIVFKSVISALELYNLPGKNTRTQNQPVYIDRACEITGLAKSTIYKLAPQGLIPCKKRGKRLYFFEAELIEWIRSGRKQSTHIAEKKEAAHG